MFQELDFVPLRIHGELSRVGLQELGQETLRKVVGKVEAPLGHVPRGGIGGHHIVHEHLKEVPFLEEETTSMRNRK